MSTNERDELAEIVKREYRSAVMRKSNDCYTAPADAILAAGYRRPRTITKVAELDALPFETVIRDADDCVLERWGQVAESGWVTVMVASFVPRDQIALPAIVLHVGADRVHEDDDWNAVDQ